MLIKDILNIIALLLTLTLILYRFQKGYDLIELFIYDLYFIVMISVSIINLIEKN